MKGIFKNYRSQVQKEIVGFEPIGLIQTSYEGMIVKSNQAFANMLGYNSNKEVIGNSFLNFLYNKNDWDKWLASIKYNSNEEQLNEIEIKLENRDHRIIHCLLHTKTVVDNNHTTSYEIFVRNITRQKNTSCNSPIEKSLIHSFLDFTNVMIFVKDKQERYLYANENLCDFYHLPEHEIVNKTDKELGNKLNGAIKMPSQNKFSDSIYMDREVIYLDNKMMEISTFPVVIDGEIKKGGFIKDVTRYYREEKTQQFLYKISESSFTSMSIADYAKLIHQELKKLMNVKNFYIAIYNSKSKNYSFPYHVDKFYNHSESHTENLDNSLTDLVRKNRKSILVTEEDEKILKDKHNIITFEEPSPIWLGAPIINKDKNEAIGVIAVQDYEDPNAFTKDDLKILEMIAANLGLFIKRVQHMNELKKKKENAEQGNNLLKALFRENYIPLLIVNPKNGKIIIANKAAQNFYGYSDEEMKRLSISDINTDKREQIESQLKLPNEKRGYQAEYKHIMANGKIKDVEIFSGEIKIRNKEWIYSFVHDISHKKKAEKKAHLLSTAIKQCPVAIALVDLTGKVSYANPEYCQSSEYNEKELIGTDIFDRHIGSHSKTEIDEIWKTVTQGKTWSGQLTSIKKSGKQYIEEVLFAPIFDNNGHITKYMKVFRDITKKLKLKEELIVAKEKAEESDRLKSAFLANMSHEIRTPMNGILGFTNLLLEPDFSSEEKDEFVNIIKQSGDRLLNTVNDLINISKLEAGVEKVNLSKININEQLQNLFDFFKLEANQKNLKFDYVHAQENTEVILNTDESKFSSIVTNLIKNAIKFTQQGSISFGYECIYQEDHHLLKFFVKDTGIGISKDKQEAVFNRFEQADMENKKMHEGSGLGLAIAKLYLEMLGGTIWLESEEGIGTQIYFTLPIERNQVLSDNKISGLKEIETKNKTHKIKILIAEDEPFNSQYIEALLKNDHYDLLWATTGVEIVNLVKSNPDADLILMDINMPEMNGYDAFNSIRKSNPSIKIIAQTAFALENDMQKIKNHGFDDYVSKPFTKKQIVSAIDKVMEQQ